MKNVPPELTFAIDGAHFARLCVELTLYWRGSLFDQGAALAEAYRRALSVVQSRIVFFETGTMSGAKKLRADSLEMIPFWLTKAKRREDIYMMELKGGSAVDDPSDTGIRFLADEEDEPCMGAISLRLPPSAASDPAAILNVMQNILEAAHFESGHCGFSLAWDPRGDGAPDAQTRMRGVSARFPGIDLPKINATVLALQQSQAPAIKGAQWLTFLGPAILQQLGPVGAFKTLLGTSARTFDVGNGLLIAAGAEPTVGDTNRNMDVIALKSVSNALTNVRVKNHGPIFGTREDTGAWLARFDS